MVIFILNFILLRYTLHFQTHSWFHDCSMLLFWMFVWYLLLYNHYQISAEDKHNHALVLKWIFANDRIKQAFRINSTLESFRAEIQVEVSMILVSVYEIWQTQIWQTRKPTLIFRKIFSLSELPESMRVDALVDNSTSPNVLFFKYQVDADRHFSPCDFIGYRLQWVEILCTFSVTQFSLSFLRDTADGIPLSKRCPSGTGAFCLSQFGRWG